MNKAREIVADINAPDRETYGPAMQALSAQERSFVEAIMRGERFAVAAREANYGTPSSTAETFASIGYRVSHYPRVIEALAEESRKAIRSLAPKAVAVVKEIMEDRGHKDRLKAANAVFDRVDPMVTRQDINVKHEIVDHRKDDLDQLRTLKGLGVSRDKLEELFGYSGLPLLERQLEAEETKKANVIEGEFTEVEQDPDHDIGL